MSQDFFESKVVKVKVDRKCHLCHQDIPKGIACNYDCGRYCGDWFTRHSHFECTALWADINRGVLHDDYEWSPLEELEEHGDKGTFEQWQKRIRTLYGLNIDGG